MSGHFEFPHMFRWTAFIPRDGYPVHRKVTILYPHCDNNLMTRPGGGVGVGVGGYGPVWRLALCAVTLLWNRRFENYEISYATCAIYWVSSQKHLLNKKQPLNGLAWGCVRNHMEASASPCFIHVSFDINNAPVSSGAWNVSKTIIKLPWKLRTCARARRTVCAQINRMESHDKQSTWQGSRNGGNKKKEEKRGGRWGMGRGGETETE